MSKTRVNYTDVSEDEQLSKTVMLLWLWDSSHGLSSHVCTCWTAAKRRWEERCTRRRMRYSCCRWAWHSVYLNLTQLAAGRPPKQRAATYVKLACTGLRTAASAASPETTSWTDVASRIATVELTCSYGHATLSSWLSDWVWSGQNVWLHITEHSWIACDRPHLLVPPSPS